MIRLTLSKEQAQLVSQACELYARIRIGQFNEILWLPEITRNMMGFDYFIRQGEAERLLYEARRYIYPELCDKSKSYGLGKFKDVDSAYDVYQVLRHALGDHREPVCHSEPLPQCECV